MSEVHERSLNLVTQLEYRDWENIEASLDLAVKALVFKNKSEQADTFRKLSQDVKYILAARRAEGNV